jgi:hypothetical protein
MRRTIIGMLAVCALGAASCGGGSNFANDPRPPVPVNLTVYINNARISLSPRSVGAGPIVFIVTNQADTSESLAVVRKGRTSIADALADTGPINPQATAQVTVNFKPGDYTVSTSTAGGTEAHRATARPLRGASLHIGPPRPSASDQLLQP